MEEVRTIERYGIIKLSPEDRSAVHLIIQTDVIQSPYSEYLNVKSNPSRSHYGYACLMSREYVMSVVDIQFKRQIVVDYERYVVQLAWQEFCNSKTIATQLAAPLPDTQVQYPLWLCDEVRFKLEPGVIIKVFKRSNDMVTCGGTPVEQPDDREDTPQLPPSPSSPPPLGTPDSEKIPLSPPYGPNDDDGNTYKRNGQGVTTKFWLVGTYLDGNNNPQQQSSEPSDASAYIIVSGIGEGISLVEIGQTGIDFNQEKYYSYRLSTGEVFNGGWKRTPSLDSKVISPE